jgi:peptidoglycan/LPS O-acetylase OafA/YrhL
LKENFVEIRSSEPHAKLRFQSLDGWRGISILLVLAGHLLPIGPKSYQLNATCATAGMAIFFILSGFLITNILIKDADIINFLIRRFLRILPLAWLVLMISLISISADISSYLPNFLFYANFPPYYLVKPTEHFWSLCVEMQFYVLIAFIALFFKKYLTSILPLLCVLVTANRWVQGVGISIDSFYRIDEILAGCFLAILYLKKSRMAVLIGKASFVWLFPLLIISSHPSAGIINYFRPHIAMALIGSSIEISRRNEQWLQHPVLFYVASISYALYIFHGTLTSTWLGNGDLIIKYAKRIPLILITFGLSHISTFYFERRWITLSHRICKIRDTRKLKADSLN